MSADDLQRAKASVQARRERSELVLENEKLKALLREFERCCGGICDGCEHANPHYPDEDDEMCLLTIRCRELGVLG